LDAFIAQSVDAVTAEFQLLWYRTPPLTSLILCLNDAHCRSSSIGIPSAAEQIEDLFKNISKYSIWLRGATGDGTMFR